MKEPGENDVKKLYKGIFDKGMFGIAMAKRNLQSGNDE